MPGLPSAAKLPPYASVPWGSCSALEHGARRAGQPSAGPARAAPAQSKAAKLPQASWNLCGYGDCFLKNTGCFFGSYMLERPPTSGATVGGGRAGGGPGASMALQVVESNSSHLVLTSPFVLGTRVLVPQAIQRKRPWQRQAWRGAQACRCAQTSSCPSPPSHPSNMTPEPSSDPGHFLMELALRFPAASRITANLLKVVHRLCRGRLNRFTLEGIWGPGGGGTLGEQARLQRRQPEGRWCKE